MTAIFLTVLLILIALAFDIGYVMLVRTQLHAAVDAATLSGGTELLSGLGRDPVSPDTVVTNGTSVAVAYAANNANGDQRATYADGARDVRFGWAVFDDQATPPQWEKNWGEQLPDVGGYNLIGVTLHRNQACSTNGDGPLPLFFAQTFGMGDTDVNAQAAAVIMPAKGIRIEPGSSTVANVIPFSINQRLWEKYLRAQAYFEANGNQYPNPIDSVQDDITGEPLFGHYSTPPNGITEFVQDFADNYGCNCDFADPESMPSPGQDNVLEVDIYPRDDYTSGNLGTIDIGTSGNDTSGLERQILEGVNESDLSNYEDNEFLLPRTTEGDTGLSAGIKDALEAVTGECRPVFLFDGLAEPGNTASFSLTTMAGVRVMYTELTGQLTFKHLAIQACDATLTGAVGDITEPITKSTTVFTPLILIE
jgi:hypothetical protein